MKINLKIRKLLINNSFYIIGFIVSILISFIRINSPRESIYKAGEVNLAGTITSYKSDGDKLTLDIKLSEPLRCNYYFKTEAEKADTIDKIKEGDKITFAAKLTKLENNTIPNTFNYKKYLANNGIFYNCTIINFSLKDDSSIFYKLCQAYSIF